jgi:hypothetical protein
VKISPRFFYVRLKVLKTLLNKNKQRCENMKRTTKQYIKNCEVEYSLKYISEQNIKSIVEFSFMKEILLREAGKKILLLKIENIKNTKKRLNNLDKINKNCEAVECLNITKEENDHVLKTLKLQKDFKKEFEIFKENNLINLKSLKIIEYLNLENNFLKISSFIKNYKKELNKNKKLLQNEFDEITKTGYKLNKYDLVLLNKNILSDNVQKIVYFNMREFKAHKQNLAVNLKENSLSFLCDKPQKLTDIKKQIKKTIIAFYNSKTYNITKLEKNKQNDLNALKSFIACFALPYN